MMRFLGWGPPRAGPQPQGPDEESPAAAPAPAPAGSDREQPDRQHVFFQDGDLKQKIKEQEEKRSTWGHTLKLAYLSQGVIYGDIGTATLYAYLFVISSGPIMDYDEAVSEQTRREDVLGLFSMLFWFLTLIALLKYAVVVLRASDSGEGGTIALYAHLCRTMGISPFGTMKQQAHQQVLAMKSGTTKLERWLNRHMGAAGTPTAKPCSKTPASSSGVRIFKPVELPCGIFVFEGQNITRHFRGSKLAQHLFLVGIMFSTGLAIADGIFMPAFTTYFPLKILEIDGRITPAVTTGTACGTLVLLFVVQHIGTDKISFLFSPIIILWLLVNAGVGIYNLAWNGGYIFNGLNPRWLVQLLVRYRHDAAWSVFGGATLCIAGAETMFAAMGQFSPASVSMAFCFFVYPCLVLTYLGQGAFMINNPGFSDPFWDSVPGEVSWPVWALAMIASLVASQAAITSTFALVRQATALGIFPKLKTIHIDSDVESSIFIPFVNYALMVCCVSVVAGFGGQTSSEAQLASMYAVAAIGVMLSTTSILLLTALVRSSFSLILIVPAFVLYCLIEGLFLVGVLYEAPPGTWVPLVISLAVACIMYIWWSGSLQRRNTLMQSCKGFDSSLIRVCPGAASGGHHHHLFPSTSMFRITPTLSMSLSLEAHLGSMASLNRQLESQAPAAAGGPSPPAALLPPNDLSAPMANAYASMQRCGSTLYRGHADGAEYLALMGRPDKPLARASGLGLYYGESPVGMPLVMRHFLKNVDAIHEVCIILIVRFLPMPIVGSTERLLVRPVKNMPNFYQVVARYGYQDKVDHGDSFVSKLISTIMFKLEIKAGLKYQMRTEDFIQELEGDAVHDDAEAEDEDEQEQEQAESDAVFGLPVIQESYLGEEAKVQEEMAKWEAEQTYSPFISRYALECLSRIRMVAGAPDATQAAKDALVAAQTLLDMASTQVVHYRARTFTRPGDPPGALHRLYNNTIGAMYSMMESLSFSDSHAWHIPPDSTVELGIAVEI